MMKKNDILSVVTLTGEYIGKLVEFGGDGSVSLEDPRMLIAGDEGVGFARGICMTGVENATSVRIQNYVYATPTNPDFSKAYRSAVSGLILPH